MLLAFSLPCIFMCRVFKKIACSRVGYLLPFLVLPVIILVPKREGMRVYYKQYLERRNSSGDIVFCSGNIAWTFQIRHPSRGRSFEGGCLCNISDLPTKSHFVYGLTLVMHYGFYLRAGDSLPNPMHDRYAL